jgi:hypothetical protein
MSTLKDIDHARDVSICPTIETQVEEPCVIELAQKLQNPNLLRCDEPLTGNPIILTGANARRFLEWLAETRWAAVLEEDLQCVAQTDKGEPLLTTWLELDVFSTLAAEAHAAHILPSLEETLSTWRTCHVKNVYIDGFSLNDDG